MQGISKQGLVVVTGGTRGVGLATSTALLRQGHRVVLCARNPQTGLSAVKQLKSDGYGSVALAIIDIAALGGVSSAAQAAVHSAAAELGERDTPTPVSCLINNAGLGGDLPWEAEPAANERGEQGRLILHTNYTGTRDMTASMEPLLREDAVVVNISSGAAFGNISKMAPEMLQTLRGADEAGLDRLAEGFLERYADPSAPLRGLDGPTGYYLQAYGFSKAMMHRLTMLQAERLAPRRVVACSPGFVATEMTAAFEDQEKLISPNQGALNVIAATSAPTCTYTDANGMKSLL